jgi:dTDP-4-amino-4,6-dideoxygalactose transaminase
MTNVAIPFNKPHLTGKELGHVMQAHASGQLSGDGAFTRRCEEWLEGTIGCQKALLTHSCTAALEMAAILADIGPGDEVIMPSFTFVSTANAFLLRGAVPVFVDIRPDTLNLDESRIEDAISKKTKAIVVVHYAGVSCEMNVIADIARRRGLLVIEDAAQAIMSNYDGKPVGSIGEMAVLSFHETKNITSGEGGALLINSEKFIERAEIIREKGTNRKQYFRGQVDKYTWVDLGSSYLPGEIVAAFLYGQIEDAARITSKRRSIWEAYHIAFEPLEVAGKIRRPVVPSRCEHNAHMYYLLLPQDKSRADLISALKSRGIGVVFHYVPLHSSPMGRRCGRTCGALNVTSDVSQRLVRLPLWIDMNSTEIETVTRSVAEEIDRAE